MVVISDIGEHVCGGRRSCVCVGEPEEREDVSSIDSEDSSENGLEGEGEGEGGDDEAINVNFGDVDVIGEHAVSGGGEHGVMGRPVSARDDAEEARGRVRLFSSSNGDVRLEYGGGRLDELVRSGGGIGGSG
ncbi:hypothetical protein AYI69_g8787, partial [Smittium culicis]